MNSIPCGSSSTVVFHTFFLFLFLKESQNIKQKHEATLGEAMEGTGEGADTG